ncbi:hypothetical protein SADUNF_Sadunf16G0243800 [Salix dunnii]|uniref:Uncharacterized protein n=1 Tax=Salix dunnii TaxID=1413687 RepID=A0A835JBG2_9ROSI|nr:hypothetical protein SADUNF_Sadunf16G0243800 [Salix dunnii]
MNIGQFNESSDQGDELNKEEDTEQSKEDDSQEQGILGVENLDELSAERYFRFWDNELLLVELTTRLENTLRCFEIFDINIKELEKSSDNEDRKIRALIEQWRTREKEVTVKVDDLVKRFIQALLTRYSFCFQAFLRRHRLRTGRTHLEESVKIAQANDYGDFGEFKEKEDNGNKGFSVWQTSELDQSRERSGDGHFSSYVEEWDQEWQELGFVCEEIDEESEEDYEEGYEEYKEVKNKQDYMQLIALTVKVTVDQSKEFNPNSISNIKRFGRKVYKLIHGKKADFKKVQHGSKKMSLMKWLKGCVKSDQHLELIQAVKDQVVGLATKVSSLLSTLMFLMLGSEDMKAKLPVLELSIKWVTEAGDSVVTRTIISLLKMIVEEVKRKSEKGKSIVPDRAPLDLTIFNEFYQPILLFLDGMKQLEHILMLDAEPHTDSDEPVKNLLCSVNEYEREYLERVESVIKGIYELKELYSCKPEEVTIHYGVEIKIHELWNQVWNSEEEEESDVAELDS